MNEAIAVRRRVRPSLIAAMLLVVLGMAIVLHTMGRPLICTCGTVKLWEGDVNSAGNSQHLSDWYSLSHVLHGLLFYGLLHLALARRLPRDGRLLIAILLEAGWELAENSPVIIDRYRTATIALGYTGDAVINSVSDVTMMTLGFLLAARLPLWASALLFLTFELVMLAVIRDNLTLNVLMLVWPVDAIKVWQASV